MERNHYMVDQSDILIAVYDDKSGKKSGTKSTMDYAKEKELKIIQYKWREMI